VELLGGAPSGQQAQPDGDGQHGNRSGADQHEGTSRPPAAWLSLRLDARSQASGRLDLRCGSPRQRDRALLLGEQVRKLRGLFDSGFERGTTLRCKRPVSERRELGDLLIAGVVVSTTPHRHGTTKGNCERVTAQRDARRDEGARSARGQNWFTS
jgi:hypothetical protein